MTAAPRPMSGPQHFREAQRLYTEAARLDAAVATEGAYAGRLAAGALACAQWHAAMAAAAAVVDLMRILNDGYSDDTRDLVDVWVDATDPGHPS